MQAANRANKAKKAYRAASKRAYAAALAVSLFASAILSSCGGGDGGGDEAGAGRTLTDPSGKKIAVPDRIETIAVLAPSLAEIVSALGLGGKVVAYDSSSADVEGMGEDAAVLDMESPDMERLLALSPDVLLVSSLSLYDQENPFQTLEDAGTCVACVPTSDSIEDIEGDIAFVASLLGEEEKGEEIIEGMREEIDLYSGMAKEAAEAGAGEKTVYFEISAAPDLYSFGSGVFLDELITMLGAKNILSGETGWLSVTEESVVEADPDVIFTNVDYIDDPVGEILSRQGWEGVTAIENGDVYYIDKNASARPSQNVTKAMKQMAGCLYPEYFLD